MLVNDIHNTILIIIVTNIYKVYLRCKLVYDTHKLMVIIII